MVLIMEGIHKDTFELEFPGLSIEEEVVKIAPKIEQNSLQPSLTHVNLEWVRQTSLSGI